VIQPVAAAAQLVHAADGFLICDAVQAAGKIGCSFECLDADALILSGHKFGGPQGVGALCFRSDRIHIRDPMLRGGGQERSQRAGTENSAAIAAMAAVAKEWIAMESQALSEWRDEMERVIAGAIPETVFFGQSAARLPNTSCFALPSIDASVMLMALDLEGFAISSGSACSSGKVQSSHVLRAMQVAADAARGALRVSLGWNSRREDVLAFVQALAKSHARIRGRRSKSVA
ncbi:MAG TPA: aminotransferase class V-fold PLP-dependent enzyme, partial [Methylocella sp.]|nr:aminotransferase class V-fold PLP-dependent enzyme [Methylocella sp.]